MTTGQASDLDDRPAGQDREYTALPVLESLDELARFVAAEPEVCIRYSKGPRADSRGPSIDIESGLLLPGLSAIRLRPEPWWTRATREWLARQLCHYVHLKDDDAGLRPWLLIGRVAGHGPDREPLLWPWTPVAILSNEIIEEARAVYEEYFEPDERGSSGGRGVRGRSAPGLNRRGSSD